MAQAQPDERPPTRSRACGGPSGAGAGAGTAAARGGPSASGARRCARPRRPAPRLSSAVTRGRGGKGREGEEPEAAAPSPRAPGPLKTARPDSPAGRRGPRAPGSPRSLLARGSAAAAAGLGRLAPSAAGRARPARSPCGRPPCLGTVCSRPSPSPPPTTSCPRTSSWPCWAPAAWARAVSAQGAARGRRRLGEETEPWAEGRRIERREEPGSFRAGPGSPLPARFPRGFPGASTPGLLPGSAPAGGEGLVRQVDTCSHTRHKIRGRPRRPHPWLCRAFQRGQYPLFCGPAPSPFPLERPGLTGLS